MLYSMVPRYRRYPLKRPRSFMYNKSSPGSDAKKIDDIPLPNETDTVRKKSKGLSVTDFLSRHFQIDELILLGLIFLLLEEKINDDFLLIILIYLLIAGMN